MEHPREEVENAAFSHRRTQLLISDSDEAFCGMLRRYLQPEGFMLEIKTTARECLRAALEGDFDLLILGGRFLEASGMTLLKDIRSKKTLPIIMLMSTGDVTGRIVALELGADDCLDRPFTERELLARIRAVLRRTRKAQLPAESLGLLACGDLELHGAQRSASIAGQPLPVTRVEFDILRELAESPGKVVTREQLHAKVFGHPVSAKDLTLNVHVSNLRRKIFRATGQSERIKTVHGVGYLFIVS